jgi:hypothetical protein
MNKRGIVWETMADVFLAGFILFIGTSMYFLLSGIHQQAVDRHFSQKITNVNTQDIFPMYLKAEVNGITISDSITQAYFDKTADLEKDMDTLLEEIYSAKVCWILYKDNSEWIKKNECKREEILLNSSAYLPLPDGKTISVGLYVMGFAK